MNEFIEKNKLVISADGKNIESLTYQAPKKRPKKKKRRKLSAKKKKKKRRKKLMYNLGFRKVNPESKVVESSVRRSRTSLRRLILNNAYAWKDKHGNIIPPKLLTLTFKENITDLKSANKLFTDYIQRLNYRFENTLNETLKYVCVVEFQKRGAVHYHLVLFNFPFIDYVYKKLNDVWGEGRIHFATIKRNDDVSKVVSYISKYISKQNKDGRFWGQKRYFSSRNLEKPIIITDDVAVHMIKLRIKKYKKYSRSIIIPFAGAGWYYVYKLDKHIDELTLIDPYAKNKIKEAKNYS